MQTVYNTNVSSRQFFMTKDMIFGWQVREADTEWAPITSCTYKELEILKEIFAAPCFKNVQDGIQEALAIVNKNTESLATLGATKASVDINKSNRPFQEPIFEEFGLKDQKDLLLNLLATAKDGSVFDLKYAILVKSKNGWVIHNVDKNTKTEASTLTEALGHIMRKWW